MTITKKAVLYFIMLLFVWLATETIAIVGYFFVTQTVYSKSQIKKKIKSNIGRTEVSQGAIKWGDIVEVIHPYFGFVLDPHRNKIPVSDFGFNFIGDPELDPLMKKASGRIIVGIFGGSFAQGLYVSARNLLPGCLRTGAKEIIVRNFANAGYKQPQQLLVLSYLLSLGAEFDIVINIDGFNEVTLPKTENVVNGVYPFYPRAWNRRAATVMDPVYLKQVGEIYFLTNIRQRWAETFDEYKLYRSPTLSLLWQLRDQALTNEVFSIRREMNQSEDGQSGYAVTGPEYPYETDYELFSDLANLWMKSSFQMRLISEGNGARYYHILQPNQYVKDSKLMTKEEKNVALNERQPCKDGVEKGYPLLRVAGNELINRGVDFVDLTMFFSNNSEVLYIDDCCHLNRKGYDIIVDYLCTSILKNDG